MLILARFIILHHLFLLLLASIFPPLSKHISMVKGRY
jgi:hypothetical protein